MEYIKDTRELKSSTKYIKHIESGVIYPNASIFLGIYDSPENYEESTKKDYEAYLEELEAKEKENNGDTDGN